MGSGKKQAKGSRKSRDGLPRQRDDRRATRVDEVVEVLRRQQAEIAGAQRLLQSVVESEAALRRQLELVLLAQQRTNTLLELSLGSAFDLEIDTPRSRR